MTISRSWCEPLAERQKSCVETELSTIGKLTLASDGDTLKNAGFSRSGVTVKDPAPVKNWYAAACVVKPNPDAVPSVMWSLMNGIEASERSQPLLSASK